DNARRIHAHRILTSFENYRQIKVETRQLVVLHHAVEALILTIATPFFTYIMIKTNFILENENAGADIRKIPETKRNGHIAHHLLSVGDGLLLLLFPTMVMLKTCVILVYFICFEALTFVGLLMYRMAPHHPMTPKVMLSGLVVFGVTRPVQVLWVCAAAFGAWNDPNTVKWQAILQVLLTCLLTLIQGWSLTINLALYKRSLRRIKGSVTKNNEKISGNAPHTNTNSDNEDCSDSLDDISFDEGFVAFVEVLGNGNCQEESNAELPGRDEEEAAAIDEAPEVIANIGADKYECKDPKSHGKSFWVFSTLMLVLIVVMFTTIMAPMEYLD
ncbi:hypothetical protein ACHAXR_010509, partial [Thalassiosira sp. AJA248-18]